MCCSTHEFSHHFSYPKPVEKRMNKILIVYQEDYPWDIRIEKICNTLIENAYEVHMVSNNKNNRVTFEVVNGINIHRIRHFKHRFLGFPAFFNPVWFFKINAITRLIMPKLIIVRDLPLCLTSQLIGKLNKAPVIFDMAENYPEAVREWGKVGDYSFFQKTIRNVLLLKIMEYLSIRNSDMIFVVSDENRYRLMQSSIDGGKIKVLLNTPSKSHLLPSLEHRVRAKMLSDGDLVLLYIGGFEFHRGLNNVIRGMPDIIQSIPNVKLLLVGDGPSRKFYEKQVKEKNIEKHVFFVGFVDFPKIFEYIKDSDICLVPHIRSPHTDTTLPNKLFDYMGMGKPVLVSNCIPLKRIVTDENCGEFFDSENPDDFSTKTIKLLKDENRYKMGENGRKAVLSRYNWDNDKEILINTVNELIDVHSKV